MKETLKYLALWCVTVVVIITTMFGLVTGIVWFSNNPLSSYIAVCEGKQYQIEASSFKPGADGCVTFSDRLGNKNAWLCGCGVVGRKNEGEKTK